MAAAYQPGCSVETSSQVSLHPISTRVASRTANATSTSNDNAGLRREQPTFQRYARFDFR